MPQANRYTIKDYRFGLQLLTLRKKTNLTQEEIAGLIGVSEKTIRNWEGGTSYPTGFHLERLIETFLMSRAFTPDHERDEAKALWEQSYESTRSKLPFDEQWFAILLKRLVGLSASPSSSPLPPTLPTTSLLRADWGEVPDVSSFYGRERELAKLGRWILEDRCRVVALLGLGGIGKTALAVTLTQQVAPQFEFVLWRSLRNAPPLEEIVTSCIQVISDLHDVPLPQDTEKRITILLELLRERHCLLVLDNMETILRAGEFGGHYLEGYEAYGPFIARLAETVHQSCLLLTSREMPGELESLNGQQSPVHALRVSGLGREASQELLKDKELFGTADKWDVLVQNYAGNPLTLKITAATVRDVFGGDIADFLREGPVLLHTVRQLLDYQFARLSPLERDLMFWLAVERDPAPLEELSKDLASAIPKREVLAALQSLSWRCLIERAELGAVFTLQEVVLEFVTERLVEQVCAEIIRGTPALLLTHALMKAHCHDYPRYSQLRMLMQPVLNALIAHFGSEQEIERHLLSLVQQLREKPYAVQGYGGGNVVNMLTSLKGHVKGTDFSHLVLREAFLQEFEAQDTSLVGSDVSDALFMEPMEGIVSFVLSPDGKCVAVGGFNGQIRVWRVADGHLLSVLHGHSRMIWSLAFSPDSTLLASAGYDHTVKLWDVGGIGGEGSGQAGRCLRTLRGHDKWVRVVAFSPDGTKLATGGEDEMVRVWDVHDGTCLHSLQGLHRGTIWSLTFSPDGTRLVSGGDDETVRVWDVHDGKCVNTLQAHHARIVAVAFHACGDLYSCSEDGQVNFWDMQSGRCFQTLWIGSTKSLLVAFSPERNLLASGRGDGTVEVWQIGPQSNPLRLSALQGYTIFANALTFGPDNLLASVSYDGKLRFWELESSKCLRTVQGYSRVMCAVAFSPDSNVLVQGDDTGMVRLWQIGSEQNRKENGQQDVRKEVNGRCLSNFQAHTGRIWSLAFHPQGKLFATAAGAEPTIKLWQIGEMGEAGEAGKEGGERCLKTFLGHKWVIFAMAFSPDGRLLASSSFDQTVKLWQVDQEEEEACLHTLQGHSAAVWSVAFSPDGKLLASGDNNGEIKVWLVESGQCLTTLESGSNPIGALVFSSDGSTLIASSNDGGMTCWEVSSGHRLSSVQGRGLITWNKAMAFSQDASMLAIGTNDQTVEVSLTDYLSASRPQASLASDSVVSSLNSELGETKNIQRLRTLARHKGQVWSVAFSHDGHLLASGDDDGALIVWDVQSGAKSQVLRGDRPYERMNIRGVKGLTRAQKGSLKALGAIEEA